MTSGIRVATGIIEGFFRILRKLIRAIRVSFVPIVKVFSILIIVSLLLALVAALSGLSVSASFLSVMGPESYIINRIGVISMFFLVGIPVFGIVAFFIRLAFKTKIQKEITFTVWTLWFISLFFVSYSGTLFAMDMQKQESVTDVYDLTLQTSEIEILPLVDHAQQKLDSDWLKAPVGVIGDSLYLHHVHVEYAESEDSVIRVERICEARGLTQDRALTRAGLIHAPYKIEGNKILISPILRSPKNQKWRDQNVHYKVYVPKGTQVKMNYQNGYHGKVKVDLNRHWFRDMVR